MQTPLVSARRLCVLRHDAVGEIDCIAHIEIRIGERLRSEEIFHAHFRLLRTQRPQAHDAHVIRMTDEKYRRQARDVDMGGLPVLCGQARQRRTDALSVHGPRRRTGA